MSDSAVKRVATAIHNALWATGQFKSGTPYARRNVGTKPSYMVWWDSWGRQGEASALKLPQVTTHKFQVDIFSAITGNEEASQDQFRALVAAAVSALESDPRLGGACIRSRVLTGANNIDDEGNNPMFVGSLIMEVDL